MTLLAILHYFLLQPTCSIHHADDNCIKIDDKKSF